jgi:hypothetical protein
MLSETEGIVLERLISLGNNPIRHFRRLPLEYLLSNCLDEATVSKHGLRRTIES